MSPRILASDTAFTKQLSTSRNALAEVVKAEFRGTARNVL